MSVSTMSPVQTVNHVPGLYQAVAQAPIACADGDQIGPVQGGRTNLRLWSPNVMRASLIFNNSKTLHSRERLCHTCSAMGK